MKQIHIACKNGNLEEVKSLLKSNSELINIRDAKYGYTPLHIAYMNAILSNHEKHHKLVDFLYENGADDTIKTNLGDNLSALIHRIQMTSVRNKKNSMWITKDIPSTFLDRTQYTQIEKETERNNWALQQIKNSEILPHWFCWVVSKLSKKKSNN